MPLGTRTSTRQAQRSQVQRMQTRNQPPSRTPRIQGNTATWVIGGTKSEERKLLEKLVAYLHVDPLRDEDVNILRFLRRDWKNVQNTLHTTATMDKLKQALTDMGVPYLRRLRVGDPRSANARKWEYWNDYTPTGISKFHEDNRAATETDAPSVPAEETTTSNSEADSDRNIDGKKYQERMTGGRGIPADEEMSTNESLVSIDPPSRDTAVSEQQSQALVMGTDSSVRDGRQRTSFNRDPRTASDSTASPRQLTGQSKNPSPSTGRSAVVGTTPTSALLDRVGTEVTIPTTVRDPDGDTVVDARALEAKNQRRRQESQAMANMTRQMTGRQQDPRDEVDASAMLKQFESILAKRTQDAVKALDTRQKVWKQSMMDLQSQVQTQERLLQERIKLHDHRVLKAETTLSEWEEMLTEREARMEAKEADMTQRIHQQEEELVRRLRSMEEMMEARQTDRILEDGSEWEDHLQTKTEEFVEALMDRLKESESTRLAEYRDSLHDLATQRELKTKAWMEVATTQVLDGFSDQLQRFKTDQQARIEEFFTVQQQNLQQDLDEFQYHAQETLHAGIFGADHPNPRARYAPPPSRAIPVETDIPCQEDDVPGQEAPPSRARSATPPPIGRHDNVGRPAVTPQARQTRWTHVDHDAIRQGRRSEAHQEGKYVDQEALRHDQRSAAYPEELPDRSPMQPRGRNIPLPTQQGPAGEKVEAAENYIARLRKTPTPMQLRGQQRQAVVTWYNSFVAFLKPIEYPLKILMNFKCISLTTRRRSCTRNLLWATRTCTIGTVQQFMHDWRKTKY